jgi:hypothetical protein
MGLHPIKKIKRLIEHQQTRFKIMRSDPRKEFAWQFIRKRTLLLPSVIRAHERDMVLQIFATLIANYRNSRLILQGEFSEMTEIERRALRNSRRRLLRQWQEKNAR